MWIFLFLLIAIAGFLVWRMWSKRKLREELLVSALRDYELEIIYNAVPMLRRMPSKFQHQFEGKVALFLHQVDFHGCNGLEVTEEMELSIAAQACLLVVNSDVWYESLSTILIYPNAFKSMDTRHDGTVAHQEEVVRLGESWSRGPVVLSWAHSKQGAINERDGHNVVIHEFAHQLDDQSGSTNAVPVLSEGQSYQTWERVILAAFERHVDNTEKGRKTVINAYGATEHEEFFAEAITVFFEKPKALKEAEPEVYAQLSALLGLDPVSWPPAPNTV